MTQLGLKSTVRPKRYQSYKGGIGKVAPNLLERNFGASKPNQKWVTDVTEFNVKGEKVYLSPIFDLYNQEIISYEIADRPQISSVMQMLGVTLPSFFTCNHREPSCYQHLLSFS